MRLRSFNPNVLNWPSYINNKLGAGLSGIIAKRYKQHQLPRKFEKYLHVKGKDFPTIRGICMARPGWCIVEADLQTAEMRGLAYISQDKELKKLILEPDDCFGIPKPEYIPEGVDAEDCVVRLKFPDYITKPEDKDKFLMTYATEGTIRAKFTEDRLQKNKDGTWKHPKFDMHWQICELSRHTPRETMNKKKDRGAAKVVTFSSSYGGTASSIARKIESDTGEKVTEDEAQDLLDAIEQRQPRATAFFHEMENLPRSGALFLQAASGRKRHLRVLSLINKPERNLNNSARNSALTALGRECRNYQLQESVAAVAAIACANLVGFKYKWNLRGSLIACLYDSCVVHCPVEERAIWQKALNLYMTLSNGWKYGDDILRYPTDCELNAGWSTKATGEFKEQLHDPKWMPTPDALKPVEEYLDTAIDFFTKNPEYSIRNTQ